MLRVSTFVHQFLLKHISPDATVLDLTCGHGNDTLFCAQHFKKVVSIDIQEEALQSARLKCSNYTNIHFIHDDHQTIDSYITDPLDACIFNSGYLPHGSSHLKTTYASSNKALNAVITHLKEAAYLCVVLYRKHDNAEESALLEDFLLSHPQLECIERYTYPNDALAPLVLILKKCNKSS